MKSGEYFCSICGERIHKMDGMTKSEANRDDEDYDMEEVEKEEDIDNT
jgi:uncharacterized Zn finger protein (UPF0148 family)